MNFLFFLLLILGFVVYYELRIMRIVRKYEPDEEKTDIYRRLQTKRVLEKENDEKLERIDEKKKMENKEEDETLEGFESKIGMLANCPSEYQDAKCRYDDVLKKNLCKKQINGYYYNVDESCCKKDCLNTPVDFKINRNVYNKEGRSAAVGDLGLCGGNYNKKTKDGSLGYSGYYFCYDDVKRQCVKKPRHFEMWRNTCGNSVMTSGPLPVFDKEDDCLGYRAETRCLNKDGSEKTEEQCMATSYCGWCNEGNAGKGRCVPGTPVGPNDITLKCYPNIVSNNYTYRYGNTNPFILDPFMGIA